MEEQSIDSWILTIDFYCFDFTAGRFWIGPCQVRPYQDVFERSSDSLVPSARCPPRLYRVLDAYRYVVRIVCWKTLLLLPFFPVQLSFVLSLTHHMPFHSITLYLYWFCYVRVAAALATAAVVMTTYAIHFSWYFNYVLFLSLWTMTTIGEWAASSLKWPAVDHYSQDPPSRTNFSSSLVYLVFYFMSFMIICLSKKKLLPLNLLHHGRIPNLINVSMYVFCSPIDAGTPTEETWAGIQSNEDFLSYRFDHCAPQSLIHRAPRLDSDGLDLLNKFLGVRIYIIWFEF